jgi:predicted type IV restriction endonuclease
MIDVHFPAPEFRTRTSEGKSFVFDAFRKSWVALTEEEWVRQNFLLYLTQVLKYPTSLIAVEKEIRLHDLRKRFDLLVYDTEHQPWMLVECKAPQVALTEEVLQQVLRYNMSVPVTYLIITNGTHTIGWRKDQGRLVEIKQMPGPGPGPYGDI